MEETKVDSATETIVAPEGSVAAELDKLQSEEVDTEAKTVPLHIYNKVKEKRDELKKKVKELETSTVIETDDAEDEITVRAKKYSDVSPELLRDIVEVTKKELDAQYRPVLEKHKQAEFDQAFDRIFDKAVSNNPDLPKSIDKELVKELALTPKYNNMPVEELIKKLYPQEEGGRATTENDTRPAADIVSDVADINSLPDEQYRRIMADPKARKAYYDKKDGLA